MGARFVITGGIGSGKSALLNLLRAGGVTAIHADEIGHSVLEPEGPAFDAVARRWPDTVVDGTIDRSRLAAIVFNDPGQLAELEAITHPHIRRTILAMVEDADGAVAVEIPLVSDFLGTGWTRVVVDAPDDVRLQRLLARGMDPDDARARMRAQPAREQWLAGADVVVDNSGGEDHLMAEAERLAERLGI